MSQSVYSVSMLNRFIKQMFDNNFALRNIKLKGEISNYKPYSNGHIYFTLKDESSSIRAVMFAEYAKFIKAPVKDGDEVVVIGYVSTYPARGEYQFYAVAMELAGAGQQLLELEMLKKKLAAEGLFDESRKRELPRFPKRVGVICAPNSAALSDIKTNLYLRNPLLEAVLFPSLVQGADAPKSLLEALRNAENANLDVLIIGRGGGASEDLSAFNDETLVRATAKFPVPVISAVGHEVDFTLIDFVADARASTPTGAAVMATIDKNEIYQTLNVSLERMDESMKKRFALYRQKIDSLKNRPFFVNPQSMYKNSLLELDNFKKRLEANLQYLMNSQKERIESLKKRLQSLSYDSVLSRGFTFTTDETGAVINSTKQVAVNQMIKTRFKDGCITTKVINKEN